jgi:aminopeptidase N
VKSPRSVLLSLLVCLLFVLTAQTLLAEADGDVDWSKATPAQIHQKMWESKSRSLADQQHTRELMAQSPMVNTQTNYDMKFYDIYIRVNDTTKILYGKVGFVATATQDAVTDVQVDFFDNMFVDSIVAPSGALVYSRLSNMVTITLDHAYNTGDQFSFKFYYHGHPTEGGFQAFAFGSRLAKQVISSLSEPYFSRTWWPCKDRNDDKADSFNIAIEVDSSFYCGSNGTLDSVRATSANTKTYYYKEHHPMANYLFSVAISPYTIWTDWYRYNGNLDSMRITHAIYSDRVAYAMPRWGVTPYAIGNLASVYGPYPYLDEKYGHSNFEWGGGMEHQTMTSMTGTNFGFSEAVVVHELSHQWWGDMVTCKSWPDIWLNEGFASYSEALYYLNKSGWDSYRSYMAGMEFSGGGTIYQYDTTNVGTLFGTIVYDKGAWVVHMLRRVLGEADFQATITAWASSPYKYSSATTADFQHVAETVSGKSLGWFFNEWIYGTYRPNYNWSWRSDANPSGGYDNYMLFKQVQTTAPQVFTMPIDVFVDYNSTNDTATFFVDSAKKLVHWHTTDQLQGVIFDPGYWILKYSTFKSWPMTIVSVTSDMSAGHQYVQYRDTVVQLGAIGPMTVNVISGSLPTGLSIDNDGVISGAPTDTGTFNFRTVFVDNGSATSDSVSLSIHIAPSTLIPGDVNFSQTPVVDLTDLSFLVSYLTQGSPVPPVKKLSDVNADCSVDLADLSRMVSYLTGSGATLLMGCAL